MSQLRSPPGTRLRMPPNPAASSILKIVTVFGGNNTLIEAGLIRIDDGNTYVLKQEAFDAIDNDFIRPDKPISQVITTYVGTQIQGNVSGGNIQGIAYADTSAIQQIISDPNKLAKELDSITSDLLDSVKNELGGKQIVEYSKLIDELKNGLQKENPDRNWFRKLIGGLSFLNDTTSSIELVLKTLPYISLILQLANQIFS